jgi:hypothetical protein
MGTNVLIKGTNIQPQGLAKGSLNGYQRQALSFARSRKTRFYSKLIRSARFSMS